MNDSAVNRRPELRRAWVIPLVLAGWVAVFGGGVVIDTAPYRERLENLPQAAQARSSGTPLSAATTALNEIGREMDDAGDALETAGRVLKSLGQGGPKADDGASEFSDSALRSAKKLERAGERLAQVGGDLSEAAEGLAEAGRKELTAAEKVWYWVIILFCFTPTNVAILCCFAGLLGAGADQVFLGRDEDDWERIPADQSHPFLSAMARSFCVYLLVISGTIIVMANPFVDPSQEFYVRLAGLISVMSFVASYQPGLFVAALQRFYGGRPKDRRRSKGADQDKDTT